MKAKEIISIIDNFAPPTFQESWDNSGLMVGDVNIDVTSVLIALDCTLEVIDEALLCGANMIITHHPLVFKGIKKISPTSVQGRMLIKIIKNDLIVYSVHTNIDKVKNGVSSLIADKLELENRSILSLDSADNEIGLGIIGDLPTSISPLSLIEKIKERFELDILKSSKLLDRDIKRVAVCGGSGSSLIDLAYNRGADLYLSGDLSYHNFFCEDGMMIMDIGHYESEIAVTTLIMDIILKKIPNFAVRISEKNANPIYYY
jgi:dinuclear metal center YbgI/SA1388 family protein